MNLLKYKTAKGNFICPDHPTEVGLIMLENENMREVLKMSEVRDQYVKECPYCGGSEIIAAYQDGYGALMSAHSVLGLHASALCHSVCRNCGSIVRSYAKEPEKLLTKKDR